MTMKFYRAAGMIDGFYCREECTGEEMLNSIYVPEARFVYKNQLDSFCEKIERMTKEEFIKEVEIIEPPQYHALVVIIHRKAYIFRKPHESSGLIEIGDLRLGTLEAII